MRSPRPEQSVAVEAGRGGIVVEVIVAWPRRHLARRLQLEVGSTVAEAVVAAGFDQALIDQVDGYSIHGLRVQAAERVRDGDRVELLRPLRMDPKEARRRRAAGGIRR
jgi:uncharacterized protein